MISQTIKKISRKISKKKIRSFRKVIPVKAFVNDYVFVTDKGASGICLKPLGIDDECMTDGERNGVSETVAHAQGLFDIQDRLYQYAIRRADIPVIHQDVYENPKVQQINDDRHKHLAENAHFGSVELYTVALRDGQYKGKKQTRKFIAERKKTTAVVESKARAYADSLSDLMDTELLTKEKAFIFMRKLLNFDPSVSETLCLLRDTGVDQQIPGAILKWDDQWGHLRQGSKHVRVLSVKEAQKRDPCGLPSKTFPGILNKLLAIDCDMILCQQWNPREKPETRKQVKGTKKHISDFEMRGALDPEKKDQEVEKLMADQSAAAAMKKLGQVLDAIEADGGYYGKFSFTAVLYGADNARLDTAIATINRIFGTYDGALFEESRGAMAAYLGILPGNERYSYPRAQWMSNIHLSDLSFVYAPYTGKLTASELDGQEYLSVYETRTKTPFYWDPFVGGAFGLFGFGRRGRGKTLAGLLLFYSAQKYGGHTVILDFGSNYFRAVHQFGGTVVSLQIENRSWKINPFSLELSGESLQTIFQFLMFLIESGGKTLTAGEEAELFSQVVSMEVYEPRQRTLSTFYANAHPSYKEYLLRWVQGGQFGWAFDNEEDNVTIADISCFDFSGVKTFPVLAEALVFWILGRVKEKFFSPELKGVFKLINADEVAQYLHSPKVIDWFSKMLKVGRNHLIACALWTQSPEDLFGSITEGETPSKSSIGPAGRLVLDNCENTLFLGNPNFNEKIYAEMFGYNEKEIAIARKLKRKEALLKTADGVSKVIIHTMDQKTYWRSTTRPKEARKRDLLIAEHGEDHAIELLASTGGN